MKNTTIRMLVAGAGLVFAASSAQAAGFNCTKAKTLDEKAICANRSLNDKDVKVAVMFELEGHLMAMGGRGALQDDQRAWLADRRQCKDNLACLTKSYDKRLAELQKCFDDIASRGPF